MQRNAWRVAVEITWPTTAPSVGLRHAYAYTRGSLAAWHAGMCTGRNMTPMGAGCLGRGEGNRGMRTDTSWTTQTW